MPQVMPGVPVVMPGAMPGAIPGVMPGAMPPGAVGPAQCFEARSGFYSFSVAKRYAGAAVAFQAQPAQPMPRQASHSVHVPPGLAWNLWTHRQGVREQGRRDIRNGQARSSAYFLCMCAGADLCHVALLAGIHEAINQLKNNDITSKDVPLETVAVRWRFLGSIRSPICKNAPCLRTGTTLE